MSVSTRRLLLFLALIPLGIFRLLILPFRIPYMLFWIFAGTKKISDPAYHIGDTYADTSKDIPGILGDLTSSMLDCAGLEWFDRMWPYVALMNGALSWDTASLIKDKFQAIYYKHTHKNPAN